MPFAGKGRRQRGVTLFGLLFWGILIAFVAIVGAKVSPTLIEYAAIKRVVASVVKDNPPTVPAVMASFEQKKTVEYGIEISSKDLEITKDNERLKIRFAYDRTIELGGPVYLLIKFEGQSSSSGS